MSRRALLRRQILDAWVDAIETDYVSQRINSERSLQASLWARLNTLLDPKTRRMFIEPGLMRREGRSADRAIRYPDLVICNSRMVIGIIELKYQPRARPSWEKDVTSLEWLMKNRKHLAVRNKRFRGVEQDGREYLFAQDILLVCAGIHTTCDVELCDHVPASIRSGFLELHAETSRDGGPTLWHRP